MGVQALLGQIFPSLNFVYFTRNNILASLIMKYMKMDQDLSFYDEQLCVFLKSQIVWVSIMFDPLKT